MPSAFKEIALKYRNITPRCFKYLLNHDQHTLPISESFEALLSDELSTLGHGNVEEQSCA